MGFSTDLKAIVEKAKKDVAKKQAEVVREVFEETVRLTPVLKGVLNANWNVGVNGYDTSYMFIKDKSRQRSLSEIQAEITWQKLFQNPEAFYTITNNTPYAAIMADVTGWKTVPAYKMREKAINRAATIYGAT